MGKYIVTLVDGTTVNTMMPIRSVAVKLDCVFMYSEDLCVGANLGSVPLHAVWSVLLEED